MGDLALVFVIALTVRLVWAVLLPPWQAFDETEHFAYANHLAEQGEIPHADAFTIYPRYSQELQASLDNTGFYPLVRWDTDPVGVVPLLDSADFAVARQFSAGGMARYDAGNSRATPYSPLYYLVISLPDRLLHAAPILSRMFAMRALSGALGALSCLFAYLIAFDLFHSRRWGWCFGLCMAFMPTYAHNSASINNDALMDLLAIVLIWLSVHVVVTRRASGGVLGTALIGAGLVLATKPTALPVLGIALCVVSGVFIAQRWHALTLTHRRRTLIVAAAGVVVLVGALLLCYRFIPTIHDAVDTNPILRRGIAAPAVQFSVGSYLRFLIGPVGRSYLWFCYSQFWGWFGWGYAVLPAVVLYATVPLCVGGIAGAALRAKRRPTERPVWMLLLVFVLAQVAFLLFGIEYRLSFAESGGTIGLQGRYLFPVLAAVLLAIIAGWAHFAGDSSRMLRGATITMFALQLLGWSAVLTRYYDVVIGWVR